MLLVPEDAPSDGGIVPPLRTSGSCERTARHTVAAFSVRPTSTALSVAP